MNTTGVVEKLREAKALLRRDGWRQNAHGPANPDARGRRCINGALTAVAGCAYDDTADAAIALADMLPPRISVAFWNDVYGRTEDEVHDLLDKTIQRLESAI